MRKMTLIFSSVGVTFLLLLGSASTDVLQAQQTKRIGIFDSRAVAIAYARSDSFMKQLGGMNAELKKAKEEDDEQKVKELNKQGPHLQQLLHQQGFSTGSVCNIIERIKDKLPQIAKENNVALIVSKWELAYSNESMELIDLTTQLVNLFSPNEQTLKVIEEMKNQPPVPIEELILGLEH